MLFRSRRLVLTHFSARYSSDPSDLAREARERFPNTQCARDGMELDVPFADAVPHGHPASDTSAAKGAA